MNSRATLVMAWRLHRSAIAVCLVYFREIDPTAFWEFCNTICHEQTSIILFRNRLRSCGERARVQNVFLEDRVRGVDFDERYVIAPEIGEVLEHALGVGLVQLGAFHYGVAQHQATVAGKINIDHFDVGIDEPDVVLTRQFTTNATIATLAFASAGLLHPHVPFDEAANLTLGIAASHHARDKLAVLLFGIAVLFRAKRDNRKKVFDLRKYPFLDDFSNLFIAGPGRVFAAVLCPRPQRELDDLVAEVLRVGDARRLLDLGQFLVEKVAIEQLAGIGVLEVLIFDPGIGIIYVAIEQVLTVIRIGFQIGFLDLVANEFRIPRHEFGLDEFEVALFDFLRKLLEADRMLEHRWTGSAPSSAVS